MTIADRIYLQYSDLRNLRLSIFRYLFRQRAKPGLVVSAEMPGAAERWHFGGVRGNRGFRNKEVTNDKVLQIKI
jgi:hypothetical protein